MIIRMCEACRKRPATQKHHKFPNTQSNRELYGKLLDDKRNVQAACADCNGSHAGHGKGLVVWSGIPGELEFCKALGIEPRSKTAKMKKMTGRI